MTPFVLALLLLAALTHASWNLLAKQSHDKHAFLWLTYGCSALLFAPSLLLYDLALTEQAWFLILVSASAEVGYCLALGRAYERADYSLVYPLARGSAPPLIVLWAALFLGESSTVGALLGILMIVAGILLMGRTVVEARPVGWRASLTGGVASALTVSVFISTYTTADKAAMALVPPPPYITLVMAATTVMLAPFHRHRLPAAVAEWQRNWRRVVAVAALLILGYSLVLFAMQQTQVGYVGAIREVSVVFAAMLGWRLLKEPFGLVRTGAAALMFAGIVLVAALG